jgi:hypothetical protein
MDRPNIISANQRRLRFSISTTRQQLHGSLRMPFRQGLNRHLQAVSVQNLDWALGLGLVPYEDQALIDGLRRCQFEQLAALVHHDCSREGLELIANLYTAIFVLDDMLDDERSRIGSTVELASHVAEYLAATVANERRPRLRADVPSYERVVAVGDAFADLAVRMLELVDGDLDVFGRYVDGMQLYLHGCVMESAKRIERVTRLADYVDVRLRISAVYACLDCGAIAEGLQVPNTIWNDPAFARMRIACNLSVSYVNDIFSYAKEEHAGEVSNLIVVNRMVSGSSLAEAFEASIATCDEVMADYLDAKLELISRYMLDDSTRGYIRMMEGWMRGNFDWYNELRTARYTEYLTTAIPA